MKKKLKYKPQMCVINISKFRKLISFTELITNFLKSRFSHKHNASSLKEQEWPLDGITSAVQNIKIQVKNWKKHFLVAQCKRKQFDTLE